MRSSRAGEPAPEKAEKVDPGTGPILKEGWLCKKGEKRRNWKVRWFVLRKGTLAYMKKAGDRPKGVISLKSPTLAKSSHKPFCFAVSVPLRTYLITAKSTEEMNGWLAAILDASELAPAEKDHMRAETQIAAALADDNTMKRVVIVLRSKEDIERDRTGDGEHSGPGSKSGSKITFMKDKSDGPQAVGQQLSPRVEKVPKSPRSPNSPRKSSQSARGIILKKHDYLERPEREGGSYANLKRSNSNLFASESAPPVVVASPNLAPRSPSPPRQALLRTQTYTSGIVNPSPPLSTAPGSVLKSPLQERKTERSGTALDDSLFALLDDLTEIVKAGGTLPSPDEGTCQAMPTETEAALLRRSPRPNAAPPPSPYSQSLSVSSLLSAETNMDRWRAQSHADMHGSRVTHNGSAEGERQQKENYRKSMMLVMFEGEKRLAILKEEKRHAQEDLIATLEIKTKLDAQLKEINRQLADADMQYRANLDRIKRIEEDMILTMEQSENQKRSAARLAQVDDQTTKRVAVEVKRKVQELSADGRARKGTGAMKPNQIVPRVSVQGEMPSAVNEGATASTAESGTMEEKKSFFSRFASKSPRGNAPAAEDITEEDLRLWTAPLSKPFVKWAESDMAMCNNDLVMQHSRQEYNLDLGNGANKLLPDNPAFEEDDRYYPFYLKIFFQKDHVNFLGMDDTLGPVIVSVESPAKERRVRALVRTKKEDQHIVLPSVKDRRKALLVACPELANMKMHSTEDQSLHTELVSFETPYAETKYKFGILYCRGGQSAEDEMYNNVDTSAEFEEFLDFMGERILLQGFQKFRGGLNVTNGGTGKYSIYTNFRSHEVMFHVATMLPFKPEDPQQRKRHLGNDVVLIVFKDGDSTIPFNPKGTRFRLIALTQAVIRSQFNHVFVVIQVDSSKPPNRRHYKIAITAKGGVPAFGPSLPGGGSFEKSPELRDFLLTKIINGERAATLHAPDFRNKSSNARKLFLEEMVLSYGKK